MVVLCLFPIFVQLFLVTVVVWRLFVVILSVFVVVLCPCDSFYLFSFGMFCPCLIALYPVMVTICLPVVVLFLFFDLKKEKIFVLHLFVPI